VRTNYVRGSLPPGETIEYEGRVSRIGVLSRPIMWIVFAFCLLGVLGSLHTRHSLRVLVGVGALAVFWLLLMSIIGFVRAFLFLKSAEYVVTDRRVVGKYGLLRPHSIDVLITSISGLSIAQGILGRIFGFGHVWVNGQGTRQAVIYLKHPAEFQAAIHKRLDESRLLKGTAAYTLNVRSADDALPAEAPPPGSAEPGRFCTQCGAATPSGALFCQACGTRVAVAK